MRSLLALRFNKNAFAYRGVLCLNTVMQRICWLLHYLLHRADETQQGRNSCPRLQFGFQFGLYRVVAPLLSFPRSISLHHSLLVFLFLADQIFYRSYVGRQHFRLRFFASLFSTVISRFVMSRLHSIHFTLTLVQTEDIVRYIKDFVK